MGVEAGFREAQKRQRLGAAGSLRASLSEDDPYGGGAGVTSGAASATRA
jgi:hypothetical protein